MVVLIKPTQIRFIAQNPLTKSLKEVLLKKNFLETTESSSLGDEKIAWKSFILNTEANYICLPKDTKDKKFFEYYRFRA